MFTLHENLTVKETERYGITSVMFTQLKNLPVEETEIYGITSVTLTLAGKLLTQ